MSKRFSVLTGILLALCLIVPSLSAAVTLTITDAEASPSEMITIQVLAEGLTDVVGGQLFIQFDTTRIINDTATIHASMESDYLAGWLTNVKNGRIILNWADVSLPITVPDNEPLFSFTLQAKATASGSADLQFVRFNEMVDYEANILDLTLNDGVINFTPLDVDDGGGALPLSFSLGQNYPNPFNPSTRIDLTIDKQADRFLFEVFDVSGRLIERRDLGILTTGEHVIGFTGENLPSGVYMYRISSDRQSSSKLMVLLK